MDYEVDNCGEIFGAFLSYNGIKKKAAAAKLGISPKALNSIINGESQPKVATVRKIQEEYGIGFLIPRIEEQEPQD